MGGIVPKAPKVIPWGDDKLLRTKEMAGLTKKDIQKMHDIFAAADEDGGGSISIDEFHKWLNEPKKKRERKSLKPSARRMLISSL